MVSDDYKFAKSLCEKYSIQLNGGHDWAEFTIDDTGLMSCNSSFGNYSCHWLGFGESFKKFLISLHSDYLFGKLCSRSYFDFSGYVGKCKKLILHMRKSYEITKEQASTLWHFYKDELDSNGSFDITCKEVWSNKTLSEIFCGDVHYSDFMPERDFSANMKYFINVIFPMFQKILKSELKSDESQKEFQYVS